MVAKNAERTIARAIRSALAAGPFPKMLLDHGSTDNTVAIAQDLARQQLRVVDAGICPTLGAVRQMAVVETQTPFGLWLDSDDEMLPDRGHAMLRSLQRNDADLVYDEAELCGDGSTGSETILRIPAFIRAEGGLVRSFERNFLPGLVGGFRRDAALRVGYDPEWAMRRRL